MLYIKEEIKDMIDTNENKDIIKTFQPLAIVPSIYMGAMETLHDCGYTER
jgi:hypothetical protein